MKFKSLLLVVGFIPTMAMAQDKHSVTGTKPPQQVGDAVPGPKPPAPITIKPSPPPNQQPRNNVRGTQGVQGPQQQVGGANTQLGDGRTLQSSSQPNGQVVRPTVADFTAKVVEAKSKISEGPKTDFAIAGAETISDKVSQVKAKAKQDISTRTIDKKEVIKKINQAETQQEAGGVGISSGTGVVGSDTRK